MSLSLYSLATSQLKVRTIYVKQNKIRSKVSNRFLEYNRGKHRPRVQSSHEIFLNKYLYRQIILLINWKSETSVAKYL